MNRVTPLRLGDTTTAAGPHRLPTPSAVECARLIDFVESDPEFARILAALMQRACVDPELWTSLQQVAITRR